MTSSKRRKLSPSGNAERPASTPSPPAKPSDRPGSPDNSSSPTNSKEPPTTAPARPTSPSTDDNSTYASLSSRFAALKKRAHDSSQSKLKATAAENARLSTDASALKNLERKQAIASHNLLKAETETSGEDFERKRAWDWTIEESERWDRRMEKKARHRDNVAFSDYTGEANKVYKRQMRELSKAGGADAEGYAEEKAELVRRAVEEGGLQMVEKEDGELVIVDKTDGGWARGAGGTGFVDHKPKKEGVDRLVKGLQKAEETRLRKRRERGREQEDDGGDTTFINEKNKQFNLKLARFYNKYTAEIRESFERGTMI